MIIEVLYPSRLGLSKKASKLYFFISFGSIFASSLTKLSASKMVNKGKLQIFFWKSKSLAKRFKVVHALTNDVSISPIRESSPFTSID